LKRFLPLLLLIAAVLFYLRCSNAPKPLHNEEAPSALPGEKVTAPTPSAAAKSASASPSFLPLLNELPRRALIENTSEEELHHGPPGLSQSSLALGKVVGEMKKDPAKIPAGVEFYRSCASDEDVLTAVRAVCLKRLGEWAPRAQPPIEVDFSQFDSGLRKLADQLP